MYIASVHSGFWFCEHVHSGPCNLLNQLIWGGDQPFRFVTLFTLTILLVLTEVLYMILCTFFPCLIRLRFPDPYLQEDDTETSGGGRDEVTVRKEMAKHRFEHCNWCDIQQDDRSFGSCPICLYNYAAKEQVVRSPKCQHVFHEECLVVWFQFKSSCPCCRQDLLHT